MLKDPVIEDNPAIAALLQKARCDLGMGIAYYTKFTQQAVVLQQVDGDTDSFGLGKGTAVPLRETYCRHMLSGSEPNIVADTSKHSVMTDLGVENVIGCYVGVPLHLSDGRIFGALCCLGEKARADLTERDAMIMKTLAKHITHEIEQDGAGASIPLESDHKVELSLWFSGVPQAAFAARHALDEIENYIPTERFSDVRLLISELVTNSVRHAGIDGEGSVGLEISIDGECLYATVSDPGPGCERPDSPTPHQDKPGGFGFVIMDAMTNEWTVERDKLFKVKFKLSLHAS